MTQEQERLIERQIADWRLYSVKHGVFPAEAATELRRSYAECDALREALEKIANPIAAMQRQAEAEGNRLSGMAHTLANDPAYLREIARATLHQSKEIGK